MDSKYNMTFHDNSELWPAGGSDGNSSNSNNNDNNNIKKGSSSHLK